MIDTAKLDAVMSRCPVMPVLVVNDVAQARPMAEALVAGGLSTLEVTLRTPCALEVIEEMSKVPGALVGAGTVLNPSDMDRAVKAGARFIVSPGLTEALVKASVEHDVPFLPGVANAGDIMRGLDLGLSRFKFFPAVTNGGIPALKSLASVFGSNVRFCPTGGITEESAPDWLALPTVSCVGGSWVTAGAFDADKIRQRATAAALLKV
ncbi:MULTISPECIES: bifunctional 4-hydroxy-2-oxoglutarate aldolase/2-dehydro-3-deoxy-phosphogluconate aldolase [Gluconobacter]|uniref:bifunctional 4-hydroxy-2-oxoglutarate aldolase/2-dehydro-3-deoxy-phosphogluconate aldolase n=1 Tax=Gluconobacter TaxID=441 RepID=UPI001980A018|nr:MULTISPECIES: bifunctional 4-hydroxy-2-oxoglutarate aldolase/2-dehydro-3-deoxy-phosphogluconate aldolase [Gluconobacter]MBN3867863.1 bifunctional 4-hydroxy-2-oxoglutarate aldolase/2-dehydro-3-deoxy-phosphogluconate aldolase [Gluconobacter kondonii]MBS1054414.1 bifunctional 4-hydroxy-2-oxoglutarate aldolase/2-dehydro-3-deoxy-phosphogluconate aldolase [Gluconobacter kondonii]MBS1057114.1 bifunctional 4-hydroxy-2-oxoglutarate aldolase/2-dehydro-3-deoxy-phosphogluconate aldolase [Gluconobacter ko